MTDPTGDDSAPDPITDEDMLPVGTDLDAALAADAPTLDQTVAATLAELTSATPVDGGAPPLDMESLARLKRYKAAQTRYRAMDKALGPVIAELEAEIVENVMPHRAPDGRWSATVEDKQGYLETTLWPRRRVDEDTGDPYDTETLVAALDADGITNVVARQVNAQTMAAWLRELVSDWEARCGEDGVRNVRGELVDAFGNALTDEEATDPTAPELALPPKVRAVVEVSARLKIKFRSR